MSKWITPSRALSVISISLHLSLVLRLSYGTFSFNLWNNRTKFLSDLIHSSPTLLVSLWSDLPTWCWWLFPCRFLPLSSHSTLMLFDSHLFIASFVLHLIVWFEIFGSHSIFAPAQYDASRLIGLCFAVYHSCHKGKGNLRFSATCCAMILFKTILVVWQKWPLNSETRFWSSMVSQRLIFLKDSSKNEPLVCNSRTITEFLGECCAYFVMKKVVVLFVACHVQDCNTAASQWLIR
jgi:hypothetical protein